MNDNERAVQRIHQMCATIESLGQELQEARADNAAKDAKIERLRVALEPFAETYHGSVKDDFRGKHVIVPMIKCKDAAAALEPPE